MAKLHVFGQKKHTALLSEATITYMYMFDFGRQTSHGELGRRLLNTEIADSLVAPATGQRRLGRHYRATRELLKQIRNLKGVRSVVSGDEGAARLRQLGWHARFMLLGLILKAWTQQAKDRFSRRGGSIDLAEPDEGSDIDLDPIAKELEESLQEHSIFDNLRQTIDTSLYSPEYLGSNPSLRVNLRGFRLDATVDGASLTDRPDGQFVDVMLMLHESGVALLSFSVNAEGLTSLETLGIADTGQQVIVRRAEIAEPLVKASLRYHRRREKEFAGKWLDGEYGGTRWREVAPDPEQKFDINEIFDLYRSALGAMHSQPQLPTWQVHTNFAITKLECCKRRKVWLKNHETELYRVLASLPTAENLRKERIPPELQLDHSDRDDTSFFTSGSNSISIEWTFARLPDEEWTGIHLMHRLIVVENALLRYWQLRVLNSLFERRRRIDRNVRRLQSALTFGLAEHGRPVFMSNSASKMSDATFAGLSGDSYYERIKTRAGLLREIQTDHQAWRTASRASRFSATALLVALTLGLPALSNALRIVNDRFGLNLSTIAQAELSVTLYIIFVIAVAVIAVPYRRRVRHLHGPRLPAWYRRVGVKPFLPESRVQIVERR